MTNKLSVCALTISLFVTSFAHALSVVDCKVATRDGEIVKTFNIYPRRGSQDFKVSKDGGVVSIEWLTEDSGLTVYQVRNPHFPWSFGEEVLAQTDFSRDELGGEMSLKLDQLSDKLKMSCGLESDGR